MANNLNEEFILEPSPSWGRIMWFVNADVNLIRRYSIYLQIHFCKSSKVFFTVYCEYGIYQMCVYIYIYIYTFILHILHICIYTFIYTHKCIYTDTHIHIHMRIFFQLMKVWEICMCCLFYCGNESFLVLAPTASVLLTDTRFC